MHRSYADQSKTPDLVLHLQFGQSASRTGEGGSGRPPNLLKSFKGRELPFRLAGEGRKVGKFWPERRGHSVSAERLSCRETVGE